MRLSDIIREIGKFILGMTKIAAIVFISLIALLTLIIIILWIF